MAYLDTHRHAVYPDKLRYSWTDGVPFLAHREFSHETYLAQSEPRVSRSLFMETGVDEADYQNEARLAADWIAAGIVEGQIASCRPEQDGFAAWIDEGEALGVRAYRRILHVVDQSLSEGAVFRQNLALLAARDIPFELCLFWHQLDVAVALARAVPNLRFVLNHCGNPDIAGGQHAAWAEKLAQVADVAQINVKMSGLGPNALDSQQNYEGYAPYLETVVDCFGPDRIVWASDWPVSAGHMPQETWLDICDRFLGQLSADDAHAIRMGNAVRIYGLAE